MSGKKIFRIIYIILLSLLFLYGMFLVLYLKVLPALVSNESVINEVEKILNKSLGVELEIENPMLKTYISPEVAFSVEKIKMTKGDEKLLFAKNFDTEISFKKLFEKRIVINKFGADNLLVDLTKLSELFPAEDQQKEQKPTDWNIDLFDSILYLKNSVLIYKTSPDVIVKITAKNLGVDNTQKVERFVHFNVDIDVIKNNKTVNISFADENKVIIKDKHIYVNDCVLNINKSKMFFNAQADNDKNFEVLVYSKRFFIPDVIKLLKTNIIENNINDVLVYFDRINGDFDFGIKLTNDGLDGVIKVNKVDTKIVHLNHLPVTLTNGVIKLDESTITLSDFKGFYDNRPSNTFDFTGTVKDYLKSIDTVVDINAKLTNDFTEKYVSKLVGIPLTLKGDANSRILVKSVYNKVDIMLAGKIAKGDDILVDGASLSPTGYDRAVKTDLYLDGNILNIKNINYYIASDIYKGVKLKPLLMLSGNFDIAKNKLLDLGFEIPNPLPSEFLNVLIGQRLFKKGTFSGNLHYYDNKGDYPVLEGNLEAEKIIIPSQRLFLKKGTIKTHNGTIDVVAKGKYRRAGYNFTGKIANAVKFPIVVKDINLTIDEIDIDKMLASMNTSVDKNQAALQAENIQSEADIETEGGAPTFDMSNLIIENCILQVLKGNYKDINYKNVKATLTLDKNSLLKVYSNRFEIAEGHSSAKIDCDLKNHKYNLVLGIKDVNSDIMSTSILNLKREISGKASGIISLNTDETLKLNGTIKFNVKNGTIQKVGLVEYVLKFAALFRNPVAMISPSTFSDMVNIPEGDFDKITGELYIKNNVIEMMKIKSYASQLSAFIVGRYDLECSDATLRIYTKFSNKGKGFAGALRSFSLNSLANRIPLNSKNDSNYYASELKEIPPIDADEKDCQVFLTKVDGDVEHNNFISSLKKIK